MKELISFLDVGGMGEEDVVTGSSVGLIYSSLECIYCANCECSL